MDDHRTQPTELAKSTQVAAQSENPALQEDLQAPLLQVSPSAHVFPHVPQFPVCRLKGVIRSPIL